MLETYEIFSIGLLTIVALAARVSVLSRCAVGRYMTLFLHPSTLPFQTPGLFAQNFVETLFVLNNYSEHPCYAAAAAGRADAGGGVTMDGIDLGGDSPSQVMR